MDLINIMLSQKKARYKKFVETHLYNRFFCFCFCLFAFSRASPMACGDSLG